MNSLLYHWDSPRYFAYKYDEKQKPWAVLLMAFFEIGQKRVDLDFRCIEVCVRLLWKSLVLFWWTTLIKAGDVPKCQCAYVKQLPDVDNDVTMPGHRLGNQVLLLQTVKSLQEKQLFKFWFNNSSQTLEINLNLVGRGVKQLNFKRIIRKIETWIVGLEQIEKF